VWQFLPMLKQSWAESYQGARATRSPADEIVCGMHGDSSDSVTKPFDAHRHKLKAARAVAQWRLRQSARAGEIGGSK
jgi:hypothetical protein